MIEERGVVLAVLCDGGCAATSGDGGRYFTRPSLTEVEPDNVLAEIERIQLGRARKARPRRVLWGT